MNDDNKHYDDEEVNFYSQKENGNSNNFYDDLGKNNNNMTDGSEGFLVVKNEKEFKESIDQKNDEKELTIDKAEDNAQEQILAIPQSKIILISKLLENIQDNIEKINELLPQPKNYPHEDKINITQLAEEISLKAAETPKKIKIIEGVFNGQNMIGPDGKEYSVPANYASKSKLVEGDILKLTITQNGTFIYKQIGPIERERVVGTLIQDEDNNYFVEKEGKRWRILPASVTYFKGSVGDKVILIVPASGESRWGAVENIIKEDL